MGSRGVIFKSEHTSVKLEGKDIQEFLHRVVPLLDGRRTIKQIYRELLEYKKKDVDNGIGLLAQSGLLEEAEEDNHPLRTPQIEFMRDVGFAKETVLRKLEDSRIAILGLGAHGSHLALALANEGVGRIKCFDPTVISNEDLYLSPIYQKADVGKSREQGLISRLEALLPSAVFEGSGVDKATEERVGKWVQDCDFAVCCVDKGFSSIYYWLNKAALRKELSWCASTLEGSEAVLGPMMIPGETACYMCYKMRSIADESSYPESIAYQKYLDGRKNDELYRRANMAVNAGIVGNLLALESLKQMLGFSPSPLVGRICLVNFLTITTEFHTVLRRMDCPHCSPKKNNT